MKREGSSFYLPVFVFKIQVLHSTRLRILRLAQTLERKTISLQDAADLDSSLGKAAQILTELRSKLYRGSVSPEEYVISLQEVHAKVFFAKEKVQCRMH